MEASIISEQAIAEALDSAISGNRVMLFMKGTPERPMCGFSMRVVQSLRDVDADFAAMDILPDPRIRQVLSARSGWPTIPQLFVDGEFRGGCDIVTELYESGELQKLVAPPPAD
jgi:monothiol glutaredoxin